MSARSMRHDEMPKAIHEGERGLQFILEQLQRDKRQQQRENKTLLMHIMLESEKRKAIEVKVAALQQRALHSSKHVAVGRFSLKIQGQVNSLLTHKQFLDWLSRSHQSLVLVDANIRESALERLSAVSVFSSTLVTCLMEAYQDTAVVVHFFCGLHASPNDAWYGPTGLVHSLILQLLMKLYTKDPQMKTWSLDFINDREFLQNLEQHSLTDLCSALHGLLYEFTPDMYVYCIIDSISCFDISRLLKDLGTVMEGLRNIINDTKLVPVVKVLLTHPFESRRAIKDMPLFKEDPSRLISLSRNNLVPGSISSRVVGEHLRRAPSPLRGRTPSPVGYPRVPLPAVSSRTRNAGPTSVARDIFFDGNVDEDENANWYDNSDDMHYGSSL
ncbi:hypothetical protein GGS24DRAFT_500786 [Hypoxylon argillaceum]|nr:hypothetical protein GGS24DRAFT_500786 [Hypoxylon argillaceum]